MSALHSFPLRRRARLLAGCALAAIATPGHAQQAFKANPTTVAGSANVSQGQAIPGGLRDTVLVNSQQAVINWAPTDTGVGGGAISILPQGNELVFTADPAQVSGAYTVLNRIIPNDPSRPAQFDGRVIGQFIGSNGAEAGAHVWFYSPGGIIAGATSRFDVGSLVLTANDIPNFVNGLFTTGGVTAQTGAIAFRAAADSRAGVTIQPGAQINAVGNYVALVAPRISQGGAVTVNGSAALAAGESVNLTIPVAGNLFDIAVNIGSNVNNGGETTLTHSGSTNIVDPALGGQARRVYMMAVPKNDAVTMLVSGAVGYVPAAAAVAANGAIFLTTGGSVTGDVASAPDTQGTISVTGGRFGNATVVRAQAINIDTSTAALDVVGGIDARSPSGAIAMTAQSGRDINVSGDIRLSHISPDRNGGSSLGLTANSGSTVHAANIVLETRSFGDADVGYGATSGRGGTVGLQALGGIITADDSIILTATGEGGLGSSSDGGAGTGGVIDVSATSGGQINAVNDLTADASGTGGAGGYGAQGGAGFAGRAAFAIDGGQLNAGAISIVADASGGAGAAGEAGYGAAGFGGNAGIGANPLGASAGAYLTGTGGAVTANNVTLSARGDGGAGGDAQTQNNPFPVPTGAGAGGGAQGATASVDTSNVSFSVGSLQADAGASGGGGGGVFYPDSLTPQIANAGAGGIGSGGAATIRITGGSHQSSLFAASADGIGGFGGFAGAANGFNPDATSAGGAGGAGLGGSATLILQSTTLTGEPSLEVSASGFGGSGRFGARGGDGGLGGGGASSMILDAAITDVSFTSVSARGRGGFGAGSAFLDGGAGGGATGGAASFQALNGSVAPNAQPGQSFSVNATASGGDGGSGGSRGASGLGGKGGNGGSAAGGSATALLQSAAQLASAGQAGVENGPPALLASATGGDGGLGGDGANSGASGGAGGDGGNATAGSASFEIAGGNARFIEFALDAHARGGLGAPGGGGAPDPSGGIVFAPSGAFGAGAGGRAELLVRDEAVSGGAGAIDVARFEADVSANGGGDGAVLIADTGTDLAGGIYFGSLLSSNAEGFDTGESDIDIQSAARVIRVDGAATLHAAGDIRFAFRGSGGLRTGNNIEAIAATGGVSVSHDGRSDPNAFSLSAASLDMNAAGDIDAQSGSRLLSSGAMTFASGLGNIHLADADAGGSLDAGAGGNVTLDTVKARFLTIHAGAIDGGFRPGDVLITNAATATGGVTIQAGRDVTIGAGARLVSDTFVSIATGDDIIVGTGALVRGANNPPPEVGYGGPVDPINFFSQVRLSAGAIDAGPRAAGEVASILINGAVQAPDRTVFMSAGAVQADPATQLSTSNLYVRVNNAPPAGQTPSNDGGQLGGLCLEGSVCLGTVNANNIVRIGETGFEPINLRLGGGIDAVDVLLRGRTVTLGQSGISNAIRASDRLTLEALDSDLALNGPVTITGGVNAARVAAFRHITGAQGQIAAPGALDLYAGGDVTLGGVDAQSIRTVGFDGTVLNPTGITAPGAIAVGRIRTGSNLSLDAGANITLDTYQVTGVATLTAANGAITVATDAAASGGTNATARAVTLNGLAGLKVNAASATAGDLTLATRAGDLAVAQASAPGGDIVLTSANGGVTLGQVSGGRALTGSASGLLTVNGNVSAPTISLASGDIAIGANGQLGSRTQTTALTLTSTADRTFVGGSGASSGWRLDGGEIGRVGSAGDITIAANPQNPTGQAFALIDPASATLVLDALTFNGDQLGPGGALTFRSARSIGVVGAMQFAGFNANQTVALDAGRDISLAAETGSIAVKDSGGALTGTLRLRGQQVYAMSAPARAAAANLTLAALDQRLAVNDGAANDGGYFQAGRLAVSIDRLFAIQNSGANGGGLDDRRGYTAGALTIQSTGASPAQVSVNGRLANGAGFSTGTAVFGQLALTGGFDPGSFSNGCVFGGACVTRFDFLGEVVAQPRDKIREEKEQGEKERALQASQLLPDPIIQFMDAPVSSADPLIDQPVTGAGNEDLWEPAGPTP